MAKNKNKTYWPHMILGFLALGLTLSYWTVKTASSAPVQESNEYMMKYQQADININEILNRKAAFDQHYIIEIVGVKKAMVKLENAKRAKAENSVVLMQGLNSFTYVVKTKDGTSVSDANVTFLLTRPHSVREDKYVENIPFTDGKFQISNIDIEKAGRYTLQLRAKIGENTGYSQIPAYLKP
ncbi:MAG: FixH family protein [Sulfurovum sp.]|nr:FixH family protein [Sulfurovum sp.]